MARTIITSRDLQMRGDGAVDGYREKLVKYVPAEVVSLYFTFASVLRGAATDEDPKTRLYWIVFVFCLVVTPLYLWRVAKVDKVVQIGISTVAFAVWALALGRPFDSLDWYKGNEIIVALILPAFTFLIPLLDPPK